MSATNDGFSAFLTGEMDAFQLQNNEKTCCLCCTYKGGMKFLMVMKFFLLTFYIARCIFIADYLQGGIDHFGLRFVGHEAAEGEFNSDGTIGIYAMCELCSMLPVLYGIIVYCSFRSNNTAAWRDRLPMSHGVSVLFNFLVAIIAMVYHAKNPGLFYFIATFAWMMVILSSIAFLQTINFVSEFHDVEELDINLDARIEKTCERLWKQYDVNQDGRLNFYETKKLV